jgi:hypothetical protein
VFDAVGDAIGHLSTCTLDTLKFLGVPALKVVAVRRALASSPATAAAASTDRDFSGDQLNVLALLEAMEAMALPPSLQEAVAERFGLQDWVTLAELRTALDVVTLPGRDLLRLRRALDPMVRLSPVMCAICSVCGSLCHWDCLMGWDGPSCVALGG